MEQNQDSRESGHRKYMHISVNPVSMGKQVKTQLRNVTKYSIFCTTDVKVSDSIRRKNLGGNKCPPYDKC